MSAAPASLHKLQTSSTPEAALAALPSLYEVQENRFLHIPEHVFRELSPPQPEKASSSSSSSPPSSPQHQHSEQEDFFLLQRSLELSPFLCLQHPRLADLDSETMQHVFTRVLRREGITLDHILVSPAAAGARDRVYLGFHSPELARRSEVVLSRTPFSIRSFSQQSPENSRKSLEVQASSEVSSEVDSEFELSVSTVLDLRDGSKRTRHLLRSEALQNLDLLGAGGKGEKLRPAHGRKISRNSGESAFVDWLAEVRAGEREQSLAEEHGIFVTPNALREPILEAGAALEKSQEKKLESSENRPGMAPVHEESAVEAEIRKILDAGRRQATANEVQVGKEQTPTSGKKGKAPPMARWWIPDSESRAEILSRLHPDLLNQLQPTQDSPFRAEEWGVHCHFIQPKKALPTGVISHALCPSAQVALIPLGSHLPLQLTPLPTAAAAHPPLADSREILLHRNSCIRLSGDLRFQHTISVSQRSRDTIAPRQVWKRRNCYLISFWWNGPQAEAENAAPCLCGAASASANRESTAEEQPRSVDEALEQPPKALCDRTYPILQQKLMAGIILPSGALQASRKAKGKGRSKKSAIVAEAVPLEKLQNPEQLEQEHVQDVYEAIADHFSHTRYGTWPRVSEFLKSLPSGTSVADVACGNGKYWWVNQGLEMKGCDLSQGLVDICRARGLDVVVADALELPWEDESFDVSVCVALLHHISTPERRLRVLRELLRVVRPGGQVLVTAWAMEQDPTSRRKFVNPDVFVSWNLPPQILAARREREQKSSQKGSNDEAKQAEALPEEQAQTFRRYCHVYREGELDELFRQVGGCRVESSVWDKGNWCLIVRKDGAKGESEVE